MTGTFYLRVTFQNKICIIIIITTMLSDTEELKELKSQELNYRDFALFDIILCYLIFYSHHFAMIF